MFTFFSKKHFLIDRLDGFVDMHNHILPGIDDGAKNVDDSIELIKGMGEFGVKDFICTPHIMDNYYPNTPETIRNSHDDLTIGLQNANLNDVSIRFAAEHMIDSNFETLLEKDQIMPLDKSYLLIEMSYLQPSLNLEESIKKITEKKLYPILAHPERYVFLHNKKRKYANYRDQGLLMQLNLLSLSNYYGKEVTKVAFYLLEKGLIDFIASDIHNTGQIKRLKEIKLNTKQIDLISTLIEKTKYNFS
jgi:tyrosine-protein phosphatase YwqE